MKPPVLTYLPQYTHPQCSLPMSVDVVTEVYSILFLLTAPDGKQIATKDWDVRLCVAMLQKWRSYFTTYEYL